MPSARVLLLRAPGTNCDAETAFAFEQAGATVDAIHVRALCAQPAQMEEYSILALPGGFSYGDDLGSGTVLANELTQTLADPLKRFVERRGLVIGICNGFQILIKTGLLPGVSYLSGNNEQREAVGLPGATLTHNDSQRFEDRWVTLRIEPCQSPFLEGDAGRLVRLPVAHGEGKFVARDVATLERFESNRQVAFRYVSEEGRQSTYPDNPNGAQNNIAGITDETGHILGLMPHPERFVLPWQHPSWTREGLKKEGDGLFLFRNAVKYVKK